MNAWSPEDFDRSRPVAVILGGTSAERDISLKSGETVFHALVAHGVDARKIDPAEQPISSVEFRRHEVCFIALHGTYGEDGTIQRELSAREIPFTGCRSGASERTADKWNASAVIAAQARACRTPRQRAISNHGHVVPDWNTFPAVVKPVHQGSSVGLALVQNERELTVAIARAASVCEDADRAVVVESYVAGEEFTVAVFGRHAFTPISVRPAGEVFDFHSKYVSPESAYSLLDATSPLDQQLRTAAVEACELLDTTGLVRVDFIISKGDVYFLEINTIPGMTKRSLAPIAAAADGIEFGALCIAILADAVKQSLAR